MEGKPQPFHETHNQCPLEANAWAGKLCGHIIDPLFIQECLKKLETVIDPLIVATAENIVENLTFKLVCNKMELLLILQLTWRDIGILFMNDDGFFYGLPEI